MESFVFDLYGTLIDIQTDEADAAFRDKISRRFAALTGAECDFWTNYEALCAPPDADEYYEPDLIEVFLSLARLGGGSITPITAQRFAFEFRAASRKKLEVYPHAVDMLSGLKARGAGVYLLSNAQSCFTFDELELCDLTRYFDGIMLSSDEGVKKPSPRFFDALIQKYGLDRRSTAYTGNDFYADVRGAKAAGLYCAYIDTYKNMPPEEVEKYADFVTDDFEALKNKLFSLI